MNAETEIEALYRVFSSYRIGTSVEGCPCCVTPEQARALAQGRLRVKSGDELFNFAMSALYTWGSESDFKHFLPRLIELAAAPSQCCFDPQTVFTKLPYADFRSWPVDERDAVRAFVMQVWREFAVRTEISLADLDGDDAYQRFWKAESSIRRELEGLDTWFECTGILGLAINALDFWLESDEPDAIYQLAKFVLIHRENLPSGTLNYIWWKNSHRAAEWFCQPSVEDRLTTAFANSSSEIEEFIFGHASDVVFGLR